MIYCPYSASATQPDPSGYGCLSYQIETAPPAPPAAASTPLLSAGAIAGVVVGATVGATVATGTLVFILTTLRKIGDAASTAIDQSGVTNLTYGNANILEGPYLPLQGEAKNIVLFGAGTPKWVDYLNLLMLPLNVRKKQQQAETSGNTGQTLHIARY